VNRTVSRAGTVAVVAVVALLATACGVVHVHVGSSGGPASTGSTTYQEDLAYAQCVRSHGLPEFPLPNPSRTFSFSGHLTGGPDTPAARANAACKHLLAGRSTT
jgi:hypothetical protein